MKGRETVLWQGLEVKVPGDWEILRFRKAYDSGFLLWAGRYGYRFQLSWQRRSSARNVDEVCRDFVGKSHLADASQSFERLEKTGDWIGVERKFTDRREGRYFNILPVENCLLEAVFVDLDAEDPETIENILRSISAMEKGKHRRWRAFGLEFEVPSRFNLDNCEVLPASASFRFSESGEQPLGLTFGRTGMVRHWLKSDIADWWNRQWGVGGKIQFSKTLWKDSVDVYLEERHLPQEGAFSRIRPVEKAFSCLWIDPADGRLYRHVIRCVGKNRKIDFNSAGSLRCREIFNTSDLLWEHFHG